MEVIEVGPAVLITDSLPEKGADTAGWRKKQRRGDVSLIIWMSTTH